MGDRAECPVCKAYTSDVYAALNFNGADCPYCGCPNSLLFKWSEIMPKLEELKQQRVSKDLLILTEELVQENCRLETKIHRMYELLAWIDLDKILEPILKVKEILEGE